MNYMHVFANTKQKCETEEQSVAVFCKLFILLPGYSGYQDHYPYSRPGSYEQAPRDYDVYTAGLSEEEQLDRALRASLWDRGRSLTPFSYFKAHLTW